MQKRYNKVRQFYAWVGFITCLLVVAGAIAYGFYSLAIW